MKEEASSHKMPPQNIEAEQSVLGGILIENQALHKVMEILTPDDFYREAHQKIFNSLLDLSERDEPGDLITHVTLPRPVAGSTQVYLKLRDRASYEFALASAAVVITLESGRITRSRIALGGVGTKPWRSPEAEAALVGQSVNPTNFRKAAEAALRDAKPQSENGFKIELAKRCLTHALQMATA